MSSSPAQPPKDLAQENDRTLVDKSSAFAHLLLFQYAFLSSRLLGSRMKMP